MLIIVSVPIFKAAILGMLKRTECRLLPSRHLQKTANEMYIVQSQIFLAFSESMTVKERTGEVLYYYNLNGVWWIGFLHNRFLDEFYRSALGKLFPLGLHYIRSR